MDAAAPVTIETAIAKARSAARLGVPTARLSEMLRAGNLGLLTIPGAALLNGGVPVVTGGRLVGAIAASGGTAEADIQVAEAGAAAIVPA